MRRARIFSQEQIEFTDTAQELLKLHDRRLIVSTPCSSERIVLQIVGPDDAEGWADIFLEYEFDLITCKGSQIAVPGAWVLEPGAAEPAKPPALLNREKGN
jgi:hypothetical protein